MALELPFGIRTLTSSSVDEWYGPYNSTSSAISSVPEGVRINRTVKIGTQEYWWRDGSGSADLILKSSSGESGKWTGSVDISRLGNVNITGSLNVSGSITGSLTLTDGTIDRQATFDLTGITSGSNHIITLQDGNGTMAYLSNIPDVSNAIYQGYNVLTDYFSINGDGSNPYTFEIGPGTRVRDFGVYSETIWNGGFAYTTNDIVTDGRSGINLYSYNQTNNHKTSLRLGGDNVLSGSGTSNDGGLYLYVRGSGTLSGSDLKFAVPQFGAAIIRDGLRLTNLAGGDAYVKTSGGNGTLVTASSIPASDVTGVATTGSNIFIGTQTITGSVYISGSTNITEATGSFTGSFRGVTTGSLSGSFNGTGTGSFTGSYTGSLLGTSSWATSASWAPTQNIDTSSLATTGSNTFIGTQNITGSVNVTGSLELNGGVVLVGGQINTFTSSNNTYINNFNASNTRMSIGLGDLVNGDGNIPNAYIDFYGDGYHSYTNLYTISPTFLDNSNSNINISSNGTGSWNYASSSNSYAYIRTEGDKINLGQKGPFSGSRVMINTPTQLNISPGSIYVVTGSAGDPYIDIIPPGSTEQILRGNNSEAPVWTFISELTWGLSNQTTLGSNTEIILGSGSVQPGALVLRTGQPFTSSANNQSIIYFHSQLGIFGRPSQPSDTVNGYHFKPLLNVGSGSSGQTLNAILIDGSFTGTGSSNLLKIDRNSVNVLILSSSGQLRLTGSLIISGGVNFINSPLTASIISSSAITGSLFGTSSWAVSASWAPAQNINTSSLATTGSNNFNGTQNITGSLRVTGSMFLTPLANANSLTELLVRSSSGEFFYRDASTLISSGSLTPAGGPHSSIQFNSASGFSGSNKFNYDYALDIVNLTGSLRATSVTSSLLGTSSWAVSASWAPTQNINTASLATTGSNIFVGTQTITGSVNISGSTNIRQATGSFTGSFTGDGSGLTGIVSSKWTGSSTISRLGDVNITGSLNTSGSASIGGIVQASVFSSFVGSGFALNGYGSGANQGVFGSGTTTYLVSDNAGSRIILQSSNGVAFIDANSTRVLLRANDLDVISITNGNTSITGSLVITGSITGSIISASQFTGSLFGTSSWALNSITSSLTLRANQLTGSASGSFVGTYTGSFSGSTQNTAHSGSFTGSFAGILTGTSSYADNANLLDGLNSTIFATTGSNIFVGTQTITGSVNISGSTNITQATGSFTGSFRGPLTGSFSGSTNNSTHSGSFTGSLIGVSTGSFTGSFAGILTGTSSWASNIISASYATTASHALNAGGTTTGSYTGSFAGSHTGSYTGSFTGSLLGTSSWAVSASWAPGGAGTTTGSYTGSFAGSHSGSFTGSTTGTFTGSLSGSFIGINSYRVVTTSSATSQSDQNGTIILNSTSSFNFTIDQLSQGAVVNLLNKGSATVSFINGAGVTIVGATSLEGGSNYSAVIFYDSASSPIITTNQLNNTGSYTGSFRGSLFGSFSGSTVGSTHSGSFTGSLVGVSTGSFTGSLTGSLFGTSSWAVSASWAPGGAGTTTGSYTGSFAGSHTGSFSGSTFRGDGAVLTGSFTGSFFGNGANLTGVIASAAPGGPTSSIQFNNSGSTSGSGRFTYDKFNERLILTGSMNISGSVVGTAFTGSFTGSFTGPLTGTASHATTASYALTSSYRIEMGVKSGDGTTIVPVGPKGLKSVDFSGRITEWILVSDTGSIISASIWKVNKSIPTTANSIFTASMSGSLRSGSLDIAVSEGDIFRFEVMTNSSSSYLFMEMKIQ